MTPSHSNSMSAPVQVPSALIVKGERPEGNKTCSVCDRYYVQHSGMSCAICRRPIEHHFDKEELSDEIAGAARMAASYPDPSWIRPFEEWCLKEVANGMS